MSDRKKLTVSASPHVRSLETSSGIMLDVIIALIPALVASVFIFGARTLAVTAVSVASCVIAEYVSRKVMKRENTIGDLSAVVTGILLAYNLPSTLPLWMVAFGSIV
ncbi:MAG: RnfABCDGE type electron transport complex subunit D, partial [Oscillospiraceae bacterium]